MAYKKDTDYQSKIDEAVANGDYAGASRYEQERNEKIDAEGLDYEKTNNYVIPTGVDDATYNKMMNTNFNASSNVTDLDKKAQGGLSNLESLTSQGNIISSDVKKTINGKFKVSSTIEEADSYLTSKLAQIQSGKTSFSDQVTDMMDKIMNREKFSYDVDNDQLFQQALASAMNSGKQAMQDTIGQASALTGGYGSTYATTAGNQAYNAFIEDAYDNLPQYYQMALNAYQMEGEEMYRQFGMFSELDDKEFNRNLAAYDATSQYRNQLYNEEYGQFRDTKNDAFAMANLQLNEHGQKVSDAYNYYNAVSNEADKQYQREYQSWADEINLAYKRAEILYGDAWNQKTYDQTEDHFTRNQEFQSTENQKQRDFQSAEAEKDRAFTASENAKNRAASRSGGGSGGGGNGLTGVVAGLQSAEDVEKAWNSSRTKTFRANLMDAQRFDRVHGNVSIDGKKKAFDTYEEYVEAKIDSALTNGAISPDEAAVLYCVDWSTHENEKDRNSLTSIIVDTPHMVPNMINNFVNWAEKYK